MAEALAAVGVAASIISVVDFGAKVLTRLDEYQSKVGDVPETFRHIKTELPVLLDALRKTKDAIGSNQADDDALRSAIEECGKQIESLSEVVNKVLPASGDSWARKSGKALVSLRYDGKVKKITDTVGRYIQTLTFHAAASSRFSSGMSRPFPVARRHRTTFLRSMNLHLYTTISTR